MENNERSWAKTNPQRRFLSEANAIFHCEVFYIDLFYIDLFRYNGKIVFFQYVRAMFFIPQIAFF